jgi:hypothetical protein
VQLATVNASTAESNLCIILLELQDLRGHVQWGATQRLSEALGHQGAGKAKVCNLEQWRGAGVTEQQVLRLQVTLRQQAAADRWQERSVGLVRP